MAHGTAPHGGPASHDMHRTTCIARHASHDMHRTTCIALQAPRNEARQGASLMSTPFVVGPESTSVPPSGDTGANLEYWTEAGPVRGPLTMSETAAHVERGQATITDPLPLGLFGLASATFTISAVYAGWFGLAAVAVAIPVALVYGGITQFLAGMWAFARGNVLTATAFGTYGAFNAAWALLQLMGLLHIGPTLGMASGPRYVAGIFVITFAFIAWYLAIAALGSSPGIAAVLAFLGLAYLCDGIGTWLGGHNWLLGIGGYAGLVSSLLATYVAAAIVINSGMGRERLPLFMVRKNPVMRTA
jgi:succinate-acetate transporter protein